MLLFSCCQSVPGETIRPSVLAGTWYPADPRGLQQVVDDHLKSTQTEPNKELVAIIVPHAGYRFSAKTAAFGYAAVPRERFARVIILAPSHRAAFHGASIGDYTAYRTPLGVVPLDSKACDELRAHPLLGTEPRAHVEEHSIEIQLPFLQTVLDDFTLIPILVGRVSENEVSELAAAIRPFWDKQTLVVVSSDFTHYGPRFGYTPFMATTVKELEQQLSTINMEAAELICAGDTAGFSSYTNRTGDTICGRMPIMVLLSLLSDDYHGKVLHYSTSLDAMPATDSSVSYLSIGFFRSNTKEETAMDVADFDLTESDKRSLVLLARETVKARLEGRSSPDLEEWKTRMGPVASAPAGTFVTLRIGERLRGCIGYIEPIKPLIEAISDNAASAAFHDPRFLPLEESEWPRLSFKLSVLTPLRPVEEISQIEVGRHGLVLTADGRRGVFLPEVPVEQGWDRQTYLEELGRKAGLDRSAWQRGTLQCFESIIFGDELLSLEERK